MWAIAPSLAEGARRALLGEATDPDDPHGPGLIILTGHWEIESMTAGVEQWLAELPDGNREQGQLPSAVAAVAGQALRTAGADHPGDVAFARVMTRAGRWILLHGAALVSDGSPRAAVIVEPSPSRPPHATAHGRLPAHRP